MYIKSKIIKKIFVAAFLFSLSAAYSMEDKKSAEIITPQSDRAQFAVNLESLRDYLAGEDGLNGLAEGGMLLRPRDERQIWPEFKKCEYGKVWNKNGGVKKGQGKQISMLQDMLIFLAEDLINENGFINKYNHKFLLDHTADDPRSLIDGHIATIDKAIKLFSVHLHTLKALSTEVIQYYWDGNDLYKHEDDEEEMEEESARINQLINAVNVFDGVIDKLEVVKSKFEKKQSFANRKKVPAFVRALNSLKENPSLFGAILDFCEEKKFKIAISRITNILEFENIETDFDIRDHSDNFNNIVVTIISIFKSQEKFLKTVATLKKSNKAAFFFVSNCNSKLIELLKKLTEAVNSNNKVAMLLKSRLSDSTASPQAKKRAMKAIEKAGHTYPLTRRRAASRLVKNESKEECNMEAQYKKLSEGPLKTLAKKGFSSFSRKLSSPSALPVKPKSTSPTKRKRRLSLRIPAPTRDALLASNGNRRNSFDSPRSFDSNGSGVVTLPAPRTRGRSNTTAAGLTPRKASSGSDKLQRKNRKSPDKTKKKKKKKSM